MIRPFADGFGASLWRLEAARRQRKGDARDSEQYHTAALPAVARPFAKKAAYAALRILLEEAAMRIAASSALLEMPEVPPCAKFSTNGSISVTPTMAASE